MSRENYLIYMFAETFNIPLTIQNAYQDHVHVYEALASLWMQPYLHSPYFVRQHQHPFGRIRSSHGGHKQQMRIPKGGVMLKYTAGLRSQKEHQGSAR